MSHVWYRSLGWALRRLPVRALAAVHRVATFELDRCGPDWVTTHRRPKRTDRVCHQWKRTGRPPEPGTFAVVIQGPLVGDDDFTLETVRLYRKTLADPLLIVSTWEGADPGLVAALHTAGAEVVLSPVPPLPGIANVNYQAASTSAGVERARERGAQWVLKTRADQRLYAPGFDDFLCSLAGVFPPAAGSQQKARVIIGSMGTAAFVPYHVSDFTVFGTADDMALYWAGVPDPRPYVERKTGTLREMVRQELIPEAVLGRRYLARLGRPLPGTVADWWAALAAHFCVIDHSALDMYWPKYYRYAEHRGHSYDEISTLTSVSFSAWAQLAGGQLVAGPRHEAVMDMPYSSTVPAGWFDAPEDSGERG